MAAGGAPRAGAGSAIGRHSVAVLAGIPLFCLTACGGWEFTTHKDAGPNVTPADEGSAGPSDAGASDARASDGGASDAGPVPVLTANVSVDVGATRHVVPPLAFGLHASVYDNSLHDPVVPSLLQTAGIALLRWPGGGYADNYHWSTHRITPWFGNPAQSGYLATGSDFGGFLTLIASFGGAAMITVNYGSNLAGDRPGDPQEAAAWVAYANADPASDTVIGVDASGTDWGTAGAWATLRASTKIAPDDGKNFLRINHAAPLGIRYWEIGNEVFGNGYYATAPANSDGGTVALGYEEDLHIPYDGSTRNGIAALSGATYGAGVKAYAEAMKAVDPTIKIGAVLNTPPNDYSWGPTWNADVLGQAGSSVDFVIVHLYTSRNAASLLRAPAQRIPAMTTELRNSIATYCGDRAPDVELMMTELGPNFTVPATQAQAAGLFAADAYTSLIEQGFSNVDWLELHNGSFLAEILETKGPAYYGIQMAHLLAGPGDTLVTASSDTSAIVTHASLRADGSVGLMLINTQPAVVTRVDVSIVGAVVGSPAARYDYAPTPPTANGSVVGPTQVDGLRNGFSVTVPAYTAVDLVLSRNYP